MAFVLFLLVTGALFIRPAEFNPELIVVPHYEVLILACIATGFPALLAQLRGSELAQRPVTVAVFGVFVSIVLADLANLNPLGAFYHGLDFVKVIIYYLLLVGLVNTPDRLRRFLAAMALFALVPTVLALLQFHGLIDLPGFKPLIELGEDWRTGTTFPIYRLKGGNASVFNDPNDFGLLMVACLSIALSWVTNTRALPPLRLLWLLPLGTFAYAFALTKSRGGFIALMVSMGCLFVARFGRRKAILIGVLAMPLMLVVFGGRMTSISASEGTGQERVRIWFEGLILFRHQPIFGIGQGRYEEEIGHVAHNSYVQTFTDLGMVGGSFFLGAFACALWSVLRRGRGYYDDWLDPETLRLRPYVTGMVAGYAAGLLSLSQCYLVPTYSILGLSAAFDRIAQSETSESALPLRPTLVLKMFGLSVAFLVVIHIFVYRTAHW